jgi:hypothetical protein
LIPSKGRAIFYVPLHSDQLWGTPNLLYNGYWVLFPQGQNGWVVNMTVRLHSVLRLRLCGAIPSISSYIFMVWYLVKHRDSFAFTFICYPSVAVSVEISCKEMLCKDSMVSSSLVNEVTEVIS